MTQAILATTSMTVTFSSEEAKAMVATSHAPRQNFPKVPVFKDPKINNRDQNAMKLFTSLEAKNAKMALPKALIKGIAVAKKAQHRLDIKAQTNFTQMDFWLAGKNQNIVTEKGATIHILQPKDGTFVANFGNFKESQLALHKGTIESPQGHLVLANPAGFMFEDGSKVDVSRLTVLVGGDIKVDEKNNISMKKITRPESVFINRGEINITDAGLSSFVAPHMAHFGKIIAAKGNVQLRAGVVAVDLHGDGNILIEAKEVDLEAAEKLAQENLGEKGLYLLSGSDALDLIRKAANTGAQATHARVEGGDIIIGAPVVQVKKTDIVAKKEQEGGRVKIEGKFIHVDQNSTIDASGKNTAGRILIGGDFQGNLEKHAFKGEPGKLAPHSDFTIAKENNAHKVIVEEGAKITATGSETGGQLVIWSGQNSNDASITYMNATADLSSSLGQGGAFEVSSKGRVILPTGTLQLDTKGPLGQGLRLIDPAHLIFAADATTAAIANAPWSGTTAVLDQNSGNSLTSGSSPYSLSHSTPHFL